jgi:hypothetical protein
MSRKEDKMQKPNFLQDVAGRYDGLIQTLAKVGLLPYPKGGLRKNFLFDQEAGFSYLVGGGFGAPAVCPGSLKPQFVRGKVTQTGILLVPPEAGDRFYGWEELSRLIQNFYPVVSGGRTPSAVTHEEVSRHSYVKEWLRREYDILDSEGEDLLAGIAIHAMTCPVCLEHELLWHLVTAPQAMASSGNWE